MTDDIQHGFDGIEPHHSSVEKEEGNKGDESEGKKAGTNVDDEGEKTDGDDEYKTPLLSYTR